MLQLVSRIAIVCIGALCLATQAFSQEESDLLGSWFVLIHYRDSSTANPDAERWEDKVWTFKEKGSRLEWAEYPIVVFQNRSGRFEVRGRNPRARVLAFWEPNEDQRAQIDGGLEVNSRGSKVKTLRGSSQKGYSSVGSLRTASASVVGYHESWSIEGLLKLPIFTRTDQLGTGRGGASGGMTRYATTEIRDGVLHGEFERDGTRKGTFRMMRAGSVAGVGTKKTQKERQEAVGRSLLGLPTPPSDD